MIKVSFIIPVYNVERYLSDCMESVLAQTERDYEVILIDDGSTDGSSELCDQYRTQHPANIQVIHQSNQGLSAARNAGIAVAQGEFLFFLDSDDRLAGADVLSDLLRISDGCDLVSFAWKEVPDGEDAEKIALPKTLKSYRQTYQSGKVYLEDVLAHDPLYNWYPVRYLYRTTFWKSNGFAFRVGIKYEDVDCVYRILLAAGQISVLADRASYLYRTNRIGSTVNAVNANTYLNMLSVAAQNIRDIESMDNLSPELKRMLNHNFSCMFYTVIIFSTMLTNRTEKRLLWNRLREEEWVCAYTIGGKQLLAKYLVQLLGIPTTAGLLGIRRSFQKFLKPQTKSR